MPIGVFRKANSSRLGDTFQSRGDIDAVAHQVAVTLLDHVAKMDADPKFDAPLRRKTGVALDHAVLHLDGAANRIDDAPELNEDAVSCPLNDTPVMQGDGRVDQIAAERAQPRKRPLLVAAVSLLYPATSAARIAASFPVSAMAVPLPQRRVARLIARETAGRV